VVESDCVSHKQSTAWERMEAHLDSRAADIPYPATLTRNLSMRYPIHLCPWLEKTKWVDYLAGQNLETVAELIAPPRPGNQVYGYLFKISTS
jgi:hypothetical protein